MPLNWCTSFLMVLLLLMMMMMVYFKFYGQYDFVEYEKSNNFINWKW